MSNKLITAYRFDANGYYTGAELVQEGILPPDDTLTEPTLKDGYWSQWNGKKWTQVKKPTTAAECVGLSVRHEDNTAHGLELKALFESLAKADSEHYRVATDDEQTQTVEAVPEPAQPTLDELKAEKTAQINEAFDQLQAYNAKECYLTSSLGFAINADACSATNISSLIDMLSDDTSTVSFKAYDNTFKSLTRPQLKTMLMECKQNGLALYQQKFALLAKVSAAASTDELDAISVGFAMSDFSASEASNG